MHAQSANSTPTASETRLLKTQREAARQIAVVKHKYLDNECVLGGITLITTVNGSFPTINFPLEIQH